MNEVQSIITQAPTLTDVGAVSSQTVLNYLFILLIISAVIGQTYATFRLNGLLSETNSNIKIFIADILSRINNLMTREEARVYLDSIKSTGLEGNEDLKLLLINQREIKGGVQDIQYKVTNDNIKKK